VALTASQKLLSDVVSGGGQWRGEAQPARQRKTVAIAELYEFTGKIEVGQTFTSVCAAALYRLPHPPCFMQMIGSIEGRALHD
jgi:hypothetical protein